MKAELLEGAQVRRLEVLQDCRHVLDEQRLVQAALRLALAQRLHEQLEVVAVLGVVEPASTHRAREMVGVHTAVNRAERVARDTRDDDRRRTHTAGMVAHLAEACERRATERLWESRVVLPARHRLSKQDGERSHDGDQQQ